MFVPTEMIRMSTCLLWTVTVLIGQASARPADTHPTSVAEVRRVVRRLDAAQLAEREAAERQLIELGPAILNDLPSPSAAVSAEVRQRLERVRLVLQRRQAESTAEPSRVTFQAQSTPVATVLSELARQSCNPIHAVEQRLGRALDEKVSVDWTKTLFWQALDETLDRAGLDVYPYGEQRGLSIVARTVADYRRGARAVYCGPFRIEPTSIDARRNLRNPSSAALRLTLEVSWEPRIRPINIKQRLADLTAVDEKGQPLTAGGESGELEATIQPNDTAKEFQLSLPLPPRNVRQIASLKGRLTALLPGREEAFRFDDLVRAVNVEKRVAGATVVLEGMRRVDDGWEARVQVRFDRTAGALESYRGWIYLNEAWLEDPQGKRIRFRSQEATRQTETELGLAYSFQAPALLDGYHFVYRTPVSILSEGFDYELRAIELP